MFLRTLAAALVAMCSLLASQTTPPSGQSSPSSANPLPTSQIEAARYCEINAQPRPKKRDDGNDVDERHVNHRQRKWLC
jgi:hypothetical protein